MSLFEKIKEKLGKNNKEKSLVTPAEITNGCSRNVKAYRRDKYDRIEVMAYAIDKDSRYTIEFTDEESFNKMTLSYPQRMYEGYFAEFDTSKDEKTGKFYVVVTFKDIEKIGAPGTPWFKVILTSKDEDIASDIYNQLNNQAVNMENNNKIKVL